MEENKNFDMDELIDALSERLSEQLEEMMENAVADQIEDAVTCAVQNVFDEALHNSLSRFEFVLENGTVVRPRQLMRVVSPDKTKMLPCYGDVRVVGTELRMQRSASIWENIACYSTREEAIEALEKVKDAIMSDAPICEL